jgi:site-specific recombinase XerD
MAKKKKRPELKHCKVSFIKHPKTPWRVSWPVESEGRVSRVFKRLAGEEAAWTFAEKQDLEIENHGVRFGGITPEARRAFDFYRDESAALAEIGATVPAFQDLVAGALADIRRRHAELAKNSVPVAEAVAAFVAFREEKIGRMEDRQKKRKARHQRDLRTRLLRFAEDFGDRTLASITSAEIETWLHSLRSRRNPDRLPEPPLLAPLSRNHYRAQLHAFFAFGVAAARGWCEKNPVAGVEREEVEAGEPESFTPEDAAAIMNTALQMKPELVPVLALQFFAGLRVSEAMEIELSKLPLDDESEDQFRVGDSKTGVRQAPFTAACRAWLTAQACRKGQGWFPRPEADFYDGLRAVYSAAGVEPIDNGARHSFISYRCAETRDVAKVADECGNSVGTIKAHYRTATTAKAAAKYFGIRPAGTAANVTHIEEGRASA